jgi:hypothetical protein
VAYVDDILALSFNPQKMLLTLSHIYKKDAAIYSLFRGAQVFSTDYYPDMDTSPYWMMMK